MASIIQKKRLTNEVKLLANQPLHYCTAYPDESDPLIWYFLIKGQKGTDYHTATKNSDGKYVGGEGGEYIGKIVHSKKYPAEPPDYYMLTPSGRYNVGSKICLTNSSYHKGDWSSTWNILSILIAFYSIWLDDKEHGISHITDTPENRKRMALESIAYNLKNNRIIYEKFDRTHLKDDIPVVLKKKVVNDEEQAKQNQQNQPIQPVQVIEEKKDIKDIKNINEMKVIKEPIIPLNPPIQVNQTKTKVIVEKEENEIIEPVKTKRGRKPKIAK